MLHPHPCSQQSCPMPVCSISLYLFLMLPNCSQALTNTEYVQDYRH
jgi:hypothetical protein